MPKVVCIHPARVTRVKIARTINYNVKSDDGDRRPGDRASAPVAMTGRTGASLTDAVPVLATEEIYGVKFNIVVSGMKYSSPGKHLYFIFSTHK